MEVHKSVRHVLAGRIGALTMHARHDVMVTSAPGRAAFLARFEREVDPEGLLSATERQRLAAHARRAYMLRLAIKSRDARQAKSGSAGSVSRGRLEPSTQQHSFRNAA